jgi:hypothetical protein
VEARHPAGVLYNMPARCHGVRGFDEAVAKEMSYLS